MTSLKDFFDIDLTKGAFMSSMSHYLESGCLVAQIKDQFDEENVASIKEEISNLLKAKDSHLLLDLNQVKMIRSSGLRVVLSLAKDFKGKDKKFALLYSKNDTNYQVSKILEVSGLVNILPIYATKKEALSSFA